MYIYTVNWTPRTTQNAHSGAVYSLAWDEQEQIVFSGGADKVVASWNVELTEQKKLTIRTSAPIYSLLVVPLSRRLFIGLSDGNLHVIDLDKRTEIASSHPHHGGIYDFAYDAKHDWVWSAGGDGWLHIWNATTAEKLRSIPFSQEKIRQIRMHPEEAKMAIAGEKIWIIDTEFANILDTYTGHEKGSTAVCWHPNKQVLFSGGKDGHFRAWIPGEVKPVLEFPAHRYAIYKIAIDTIRNIILTVSRDGSLKTWSLESLAHLSTIAKAPHFHTHSINTLLLTGHLVYTGSDDKKIIAWSLSQGIGEEPH